MQIDIERSILSSIFFNPEEFDLVAEIVEPSDFLHEGHKNIFAAMLELQRLSLPIEAEFVLKRSTKHNPINQEEIISILSTSPIANLIPYAQEIKEAAIKRKLHTLAIRMNDLSIDENQPSVQILDHLQAELYKLSSMQIQKEFQSAQEVVSKTLDYIIAMKQKGTALVGIDTGFHGLNEKTAGFGRGDLIIVAARPSMGKTALVLNIAQKVLNQGLGVAFFSLEMPSEQLMLRMLASKTSLPLQNLRTGKLLDHEIEILTKAADEMSNASFYVDDKSSLTINELRSKLRKLKTKHKEIDLAIVDYLQLMSSASNKDRHLEVSDISRGIKMIARELDIPIIALSQLNRSLESRSDRRPMLSDLRESGSIEQDADLILFVYRDDVYKLKDEKEKEEKAKKEGVAYKGNFVLKDEEEAEIIIGKQRNGPTGVIKLVFQKHCTRFMDAKAFDKPLEVVYENLAQQVKIDLPPL